MNEVRKICSQLLVKKYLLNIILLMSDSKTRLFDYKKQFKAKYYHTQYFRLIMGA